jgi:hypothetical protein
MRTVLATFSNVQKNPVSFPVNGTNIHCADDRPASSHPAPFHRIRLTTRRALTPDPLPPCSSAGGITRVHPEKYSHNNEYATVAGVRIFFHLRAGVDRATSSGYSPHAIFALHYANCCD